MAGRHGERCQDREDLLEVALAQLGVLLGDLRVVDDRDALRGEPAAKVADEERVIEDEAGDPLADGGELLGRGAPVGRVLGAAGRHLLHESRHPHLEELVQVGREDGQELGPLEEGVPLVPRLVQDAGIEVEPGQLAVDVRHAGGATPGRGAVAARP